MTYHLVVGWTAPIDIELKTRGATPAGTMSGMTVAIVLTERFTGEVLSTASDLSIADSTNWVVRFTPDSTDLVSGDYHGRIQVTDAVGGVAFFPSEEPDLWVIRAV